MPKISQTRTTLISSDGGEGIMFSVEADGTVNILDNTGRFLSVLPLELLQAAAKASSEAQATLAQLAPEATLAQANTQPVLDLLR